MSIAIPERILNYKVSAMSPTDELLTLRHIYSEVGGYASTILDREHLSLAKKCATRLDKVVKQLNKRQSMWPGDSRHEGVYADLSELSIGELYELYRLWPARHRERAAQGREHMTFYYEGKIVRELQRRVAADEGEQLKIDYCTITYRNELENLGFIFSLPVGQTFQKWDKSEEQSIPSISKDCTPLQLLSLITLYSSYRDITEREALSEYVDIALDLMESVAVKDESPDKVDLMKSATEKVELMELASELVELGRKRIIAIPTWVTQFLEVAVELAHKDECVHESELVVPLLTLQLQNGSQKLEREATRIINRCYRRAIGSDGGAKEMNLIGEIQGVSTGDTIRKVNDLYTAVTCADYVSRFSVRKMGKSWNELTTRLIPSMREQSTLTLVQGELSKQTFVLRDVSTQSLVCLLTVATEIEDYTNISADNKATLLEELERRAQLGDIEALCYMQSLPTPIAEAV